MEYRLELDTFDTHPVGQRIVLYGLPALVSDVVKGVISANTRASVVAELTMDADLARAVTETNADLVISTLEGDELPAACADLMADRARVRVIALPPEAASAHLVELLPEFTSLEGLTTKRFVEALLERSSK